MNARQARQRRALFYPHWFASTIPADRIEDSTNNLSQNSTVNPVPPTPPEPLPALAAPKTDDPTGIVVPSEYRERGISPLLSPVNTVEPERRTPPQLSPPKDAPSRCRFYFSDGRQCRMPSAEPNARFCAHHARKTKKPRKQSHASQAFVELQTLSGKFTTATDLNDALSQVFRSLAQNRIRPRNAATLGYLGQILLQTLPGVKSEFSNTFGFRAWDESVKALLGIRASERAAAKQSQPSHNEHLRTHHPHLSYNEHLRKG